MLLLILQLMMMLQAPADLLAVTELPESSNCKPKLFSFKLPHVFRTCTGLMFNPAIRGRI